MPLDRLLVGEEFEPVERSWNSTDAILYALGVGAAAEDPATELEYTTENILGVPQRVLPTFGVGLTSVQPVRTVVDVDPSAIVHAGQSLVLHAPLPVEGTVLVSTRIIGLEDKGKGALPTYENTAVDPAGQALVTTTSATFIRGAGGFGGERAASPLWTGPGREPDQQVHYPTRPNQALLYRISGDRNPLHSDPFFARRQLSRAAVPRISVSFCVRLTGWPISPCVVAAALTRTSPWHGRRRRSARWASRGRSRSRTGATTPRPMIRLDDVRELMDGFREKTKAVGLPRRSESMMWSAHATPARCLSKPSTGHPPDG
jgi:hypothetical protein